MLLVDTNIGIRVDHHHGLLEVNKNDRLRNINNIVIFVKQCQKIYYIYTFFFLEMIIIELIGYPLLNQNLGVESK
jgi:hypothetical protein